MRADVRAKAVLALHLLALRRQFDVIRQVFGDDPPHRAREALWAMLEITSADLHQRPIALRDLVVRAEGLLSGPTLSRVVADLERSGLLASDPAPEDSRVKRLRPTARTLEILMTRAEAAFTEFADIIKEAELEVT
jgi:DNA-binding MarR family transcriptional regulator